MTAQYNGDTPLLQSGTLFRSLSALPSPKSGVTKYRIVLEDGKVWYVYAYSEQGQHLTLTLVDQGLITATSGYQGIIQVAKGVNAAESIYDAASGAFATGLRLTGEVTAATASYSFDFNKGGRADTKLLIFALPHHVDSFSQETKSALITTFQLQTTTKGIAKAVLADRWALNETVPLDIGNKLFGFL